MQSERTMDTLDFSFCTVSDKEITILSWLLEKNLIRHLFLRNIGLIKGSLTRFCAGVSKSTSLQSLDLSENEVNELDLSVLLQALMVADTCNKLILNKLQ